MLKRSRAVNLFICAVLGGATTSFIWQTVFDGNPICGIMAVLTGIATAVNALCGPSDKECAKPNKEDKHQIERGGRAKE